ncbi:MAG: C2H2-type zinc finger protein [Nitrososphaeraceae archaeon]
MSSSESSSKPYKCSICGMTFESLGDMRTHMTTEHLQKGDFPLEEKQ